MASLIVVLVIVATSVWVYWDATQHKIGKIKGAGGAFNMSAGAWAVVTMLLWIVAFPSYLIKRKDLIAKAAENPVDVTGRGVKLGVLSTVGGVWVLMQVAAIFAGSLPTCDSPEVVGLAKQAVQNAPAIQMSGITVHDIVTPGEREYDASAEKRTCRAVLKSSLGDETILYSVDWQDKGKNLIWVQIIGNE